MDLKDNGKDISGIAHKADYSGSHDEKAERFAKAFLEFLKSLIDDAGITEEEWKEAFEHYDEGIGELFFLIYQIFCKCSSPERRFQRLTTLRNNV